MTLRGCVHFDFEDNVYLRRGVLAWSDAELVERAVNIAKELDQPVGTPEEAREMLRRL